MHEVRRFDGKGNLIETIPGDELNNRFWDNMKNKKAPNPAAAKPRNKICANCGELFTVPRASPRTKFCHKPGVKESQQCRRIDYRKRHAKKNPKIKKKCQLCGAGFETVNPRVKFCRAEGCNSNAFEKLQRARRGGVKRACKWCGTSFQAGMGNQQFCQKECSNMAILERKRQKT